MTDPEQSPAPLELPIDGTLDLHAFAPADVRSVVEEYLWAAADLGVLDVRVVHGRGTGVLRGIVQAALDAHPAVAAFADDPSSHLGATIVRLHQGSRPHQGR